MSQQPTPRGSLRPLNPGVRELVANKRSYSSPLDRKNALFGFRGWHEAGRLPHRDEPGLAQFVTFRLADSFPASLRSEWEDLWEIEDAGKRRTELEAYLDKGRGQCHLRCPEIAALVETALRFFHGTRYELRAWVIMSNHVHVLFKVDSVPMSEIVESWKKHTANKANGLLKRHGAFGQPLTSTPTFVTPSMSEGQSVTLKTIQRKQRLCSIRATGRGAAPKLAIHSDDCVCEGRRLCRRPAAAGENVETRWVLPHLTACEALRLGSATAAVR